MTPAVEIISIPTIDVNWGYLSKDSANLMELFMMRVYTLNFIGWALASQYYTASLESQF